MKFSDLKLSEPIARAVAGEGYELATPIQAQSIPYLLAGRDLLGSARTGTGKTAAFALPILQLLSSRPRSAGGRGMRALILCPTRELATQIGDSFRTYGKFLKLRHTVIFGGMNQNPQVSALRNGVEIVVATPGRLLDLIDQGHVDLRSIECFVLDEADRMLDMGFINDIRKIAARLPVERQNMLFSATMPREIRSLADSMLRNPAVVQVAEVSSTHESIEQVVYFVEKRNKPQLLAHLVTEMPMTRAIVFTKTKHGADKVVRQLAIRGIKAEAIHGNKSQNNRQRALHGFKMNKIGVLVATDIASRGIDIDGITHVVNFDLTHEPETYVHRIGRTARAGAEGMAVSFCDRDERSNLRAIERLIRKTIAIRNDHPVYAEPEPAQKGESSGSPARDAYEQRSRQPRPDRPAAHGISAARGPSSQGRRDSAQRSQRPFPAEGTSPRGRRHEFPHAGAAARPLHAPHKSGAPRHPTAGRPKAGAFGPKRRFGSPAGR